MTEEDPARTVWFSDMLTLAEILPYTHAISEADHKVGLGITINVTRGVPQGPECFPEDRFWFEKSRKVKAPRHVTRCAGYVVSEPVAEILNKFDLGRTRLYPTRFFEYDRKTPVPGRYFSLSLGETKDGVIVERSRLDEAYGGGLTGPPDPTDGDFVLRPSVLKGPDMWVDTGVQRALFLSGPLVVALRAAKLDKQFLLSRCTVAEG